MRRIKCLFGFHEYRLALGHPKYLTPGPEIYYVSCAHCGRELQSWR